MRRCGNYLWKKNTFRAYSLVALVRLQTRDISLFTMVGPLAKYPGQRNSTKKIVYDLTTDGLTDRGSELFLPQLTAITHSSCAITR